MKSVVSARWWLTIILFTLVTVIAVGGLLWVTLGQSKPSLGACDPATGQGCPYAFSMPSVLAPGSTEAASINALFTMILVLAAIVFVVVEGVLIYTVLKHRNRPPEMAIQIHGDTKLEVAWTAAPAVILVVIMGFTLRTMSEVRGAAPGGALKVKAIGHQFWWEFRYPDQGIVTASELVVPINTTVEVALESVDVEHGFWAPELFGKTDAIPGYTTRARFTPTQLGRREYGGQCTQYCGTQHAQMRFSVIVLSRADYDAWVAQHTQPAAAVETLTGAAAAGAQAFYDPQNACVACHAVDGTTAAGQIGPNLTHVGSRGYLAGGILANTPENLSKWLHDPQGVKPGNKMVIRKLDDATVTALIAYLTSLK